MFAAAVAAAVAAVEGIDEVLEHELRADVTEEQHGHGAFSPLAGSPRRGTVATVALASPPRPQTGLCFAFLNSLGDVNIIREVDSLLLSIGSSFLDDTTDAVVFSEAEVLTAAAVVSGWHSAVSLLPFLYSC